MVDLISHLTLDLMAYVTFALLVLVFRKPGLDSRLSAFCIVLLSVSYWFYLFAGRLLTTEAGAFISHYFQNIWTIEFTLLPVLISAMGGSWTGVLISKKFFYQA